MLVPAAFTLRTKVDRSIQKCVRPIAVDFVAKKGTAGSDCSHHLRHPRSVAPSEHNTSHSPRAATAERFETVTQNLLYQMNPTMSSSNRAWPSSELHQA